MKRRSRAPGDAAGLSRQIGVSQRSGPGARSRGRELARLAAGGAAGEEPVPTAAEADGG